MNAVLVIALVMSVEGGVPGTYSGSQMGKPDELTLSWPGQGTWSGKPVTWHPKAGRLQLEGMPDISWSVITADALALTLTKGEVVVCRVATRTAQGAAIPKSRGAAGEWEWATDLTCMVHGRPAKLTVRRNGAAQFCASLTAKQELQPTCYLGQVDTLAGEIVTGEESVPFTVLLGGDLVLATGTALDVGEVLTYRRVGGPAKP